MSKSSHLRKILSALWLTASIFIGSSGLVSSVLKYAPEKNSQNKRNQKTSSRALHGTVEVSFKIGLDGKANILNIKSANLNLVKYVKSKLNKIELQKDDISLEEVITYRFIFKKDA